MANMESIIVIATPAGSETVFVVMAYNITQSYLEKIIYQLVLFC